MFEATKDLRDKAFAIKRLREKIKELTEYKDRCEIALVEELKKASPKQKTFILDDICVTVTDNKGYSLNEEGKAIMNTLPYTDKLWKKDFDMKEIRNDPRFAFYIVETPYRARVTLKESSKNND